MKTNVQIAPVSPPSTRIPDARLGPLPYTLPPTPPISREFLKLWTLSAVSSSGRGFGRNNQIKIQFFLHISPCFEYLFAVSQREGLGVKLMIKS